MVEAATTGAEKAPQAYRTISEVAIDLDLPQHVLRFWETRFGQIKPLKRGGGRRYYRPDDVALLKGIRELLYGRHYTIKGVQRILREEGPRAVQAIGRGEPARLRLDPAAADPEAALSGPQSDPAIDLEQVIDDRDDVSMALGDPLGETHRPPTAEPSAPVSAPALDAEAISRLISVLDDLAEVRRLLALARSPFGADEPAA